MAKEKNEITKPAETETALAVSQQELDNAFGGPEAQKPPIDVAWPEIKMTKTDEFKMPDGTKTKEIVCNIAFTQRSRSYWKEDFDGNNSPPDCASDDCITPSMGEQQQCEKCAGCDMSQWQEVEKEGKTRNAMLCALSLNMILLLDGKEVPYVMRVRSTSIGKKSALAVFFTMCLENGFALAKKFQTVTVKLTLKEVKINGFETSVLEVEKVTKLESDNPVLPKVIEMYNMASEEFVVKHQRDDAASDDDSPFAKEEPVEEDNGLPTEMQGDEPPI